MRRDPGAVTDARPAPAEARARPDPPTTEEIIRSVVAEAIWAPSVHNTQPWCFTADGPRIRLYADVGRQLTAADPDGREMMISCGAALFTARLAFRPLGYLPETRVLPDPADPTLVAQLSWPRRAPVTEYERRLSGQVRLRRTHRGGFDPVPLSPTLLTALREGAARDGATLRIVADPGRRAALLTAGTCGVAAALHSQPVEFGWLREFIRTRLGDGGYPQLVLRLGTVIQIATSVRRPPADVLLSTGTPAGARPGPA